MFKKMVLLIAALVMLLGSEAVYADTLIRSGLVSSATSPDSSDMVVVIKDNATGDIHEIVITDNFTKNKFKQGSLKVGDKVRLKFDDIGGRKVSKMFRRTDGSDSSSTSVASTTTSANISQSSNATCDANVPNPSPLPNETASFYGECRDGKPLNGIIMWKQSGVPFSLSCLKNGRFADGSSTFNFDQCKAYYNLIPNYCNNGDYNGQCTGNTPNGVGVKAWKAGGILGDYKAISGQFVNGEPHGYNSYGEIRRCGALGCTGGFEIYHAWYTNGKEEYRCEGGPEGCVKLKKAQTLYEKAQAAEKVHRCEDALKYDRQAQAQDGQKHSDSDYSNGNKISFSSCTADRTLNHHLKAKNPQSMYLAAGNYERNGDSYSARKVYNAIIERFSSSQWAVKANDRLLGIKADSDASSRQSEFESNRRYEREKDAQACRNRKSSCWSSCSDIKNYDAKSSCQSRCNSICSE